MPSVLPVLIAESPVHALFLHDRDDMVKIGERTKQYNVSPGIVEDNDKSGGDQKVSRVQRMLYQRVRPTIPHPPLAHRGVASPRPEAEPLPKQADADTDDIGQGVEERAASWHDRS